MIVSFIPNKSYAIVAGYDHNDIVAVLGGVQFFSDDSIEVHFPKANPFHVGQSVTMHIDNRIGIEEFDSNLKVYRSSVKGLITASRENTVTVKPVEYEMVYSSKVVEKFMAPGFTYPEDDRPAGALPESAMRKNVVIDSTENRNKLGVLVTKGIGRPHTTVMAFLSTKDDDIFIISHKDTLKSRNLARDGNCVFAIDHRGTYLFERAIEWNYTIIKGTASIVSKSHEAFGEIQAAFIDKNPWEYSFFTDEKVVMYHIKPVELLCPEKYQA